MQVLVACIYLGVIKSSGQFPGEQGLVASGMSAQFKVRFMPDSLGEYSDEIHVQSQSSEPLIVKVIAKRPPPVLTCEFIDCQALRLHLTSSLKCVHNLSSLKP